MAKKIVLALVLAAIVGGGGVFAQLSIEGGAATDFSSVTPAIGIGIGLPGLDILAGVNIYIYNTKTKYENASASNTSRSLNSVGIYAGIAPIAALTDVWTFSIPLLVQVNLGGGTATKYPNNSSLTVVAGAAAANASSDFGIDVKAGARAAYAFSDHWSLYTGFLLNAISWNQSKPHVWKTNLRTGGTKPGTTATSTFTVLSTGVVQLGVSYKF